jgi:hypothetical protein
MIATVSLPHFPRFLLKSCLDLTTQNLLYKVPMRENLDLFGSRNVHHNASLDRRLGTEIKILFLNLTESF